MDDSPDSNSFEASLPDDPIAVTSAYLKHRGVKGTIIFAMLTGSQAYNLAHKDSDKDYLGIYIVDTKALLAIDGELGFPNQPLSSLPNETGYPDCALYEVKQFMKLAVKGNPFMVEALFSRENYVSTPCFDRLRAVRRSILTRQLVEEFLSYIRGQLAIHQRKGLKGKRVYHIARLLFELRRIVNGKEPQIALEFGPERNRLIAIRNIVEPSVEEITEEANALMSEIELLRPWNLPEQCDDSFNDWLVAERTRLFINPDSGAS